MTTTKKSSNSPIYIMSGVIGAGFLIVMLAMGGGGIGGGGTGKEVCDLRGEVSFNVHDFNLNKYVDAWNVNLSPANCREANIFGFNAIQVDPGDKPALEDEQLNYDVPDPLPQGALIGKTELTVIVKIFDGQGELVKSKTINISGYDGKAEFQVTDPLLFTALEHGGYTVKVYHTWTGDSVAYTKNVSF